MGTLYDTCRSDERVSATALHCRASSLRRAKRAKRVRRVRRAKHAKRVRRVRLPALGPVQFAKERLV